MVAALLAALAVWAGLTALRPGPPPTVQVVVAARQLPAGHRLSGADLTVHDYPVALAPADAIADPTTVVGRHLVGPLAEGSPVGLQAMVTTRTLAPGHLLAPIRVGDAAVLGLLRVGDRVTLTATTSQQSATVVARGVPVAAIPRAPDAGPLGGGSDTASLILVEVAEQTAADLHRWSQEGALGVSLG